MSDLMVTRFQSVQPTADRVGMRRRVPSLRVMLRTYLTRKTLPELTRRELADIGVSSSAALAEAARLPWDIGPNPRRQAGSIVETIQHALERARTRRLISQLAARELRDIGVSRSDAQAEASKPFWRM